MNSQQLEVYQQLKQFSLNNCNAVFLASQRIASDDSWTVLSDNSIYQDWRARILLTLSGLFFLMGIIQLIYHAILVNLSDFITPVGSSDFQDKYNIHDRKVGVAQYLINSAFTNSFIALAAILLLFFPPAFQWLIFPALSVSFIRFLYDFLTEQPKDDRGNPKSLSPWTIPYLIPSRQKDKNYIRSLRCKNCKRPLAEISKDLALEDIGFKRSKIVAAKMNDVRFQVWHCSWCYSEINQETIHLYTLGSYNAYRTAHCPICKERTMRITCQTLERSTEEKEGKEMTVFTCECCGRRDEDVRTTPKRPKLLCVEDVL